LKEYPDAKDVAIGTIPLIVEVVQLQFIDEDEPKLK
jgi:hypothetical protein